MTRINPGLIRVDRRVYFDFESLECPIVWWLCGGACDSFPVSILKFYIIVHIDAIVANALEWVPV